VSKKKTTASDAASLMARRSVKARIKKWGKAEFRRRMQEWGKLGGRPKGSGSKQAKNAKKGGK
jgi:hypothetical protein